MTLPTFYYAQGTSFLLNAFGHVYAPTPISPGWVAGVNNDFYYWEGGLIDDPFPRLLDTSLWQYKRVQYPASSVGMGLSIVNGVDWMVGQILATPVGTPFAIGGYSQGAAVASRVYSECRQGRLSKRRADLRAVVTFGNPMREQGHTFPGSSGYSGSCDVSGDTLNGHGTFPSLESMGRFDTFVRQFARLRNTESLVWDFTMPNEVISGVGDSQEGKLMQEFTKDGLRLVPVQALALVQQVMLASNSLWNQFGVAPPGVPQNSAKKVQITDPKTGEVSYADGGGHIMYPHFPPPNADGSIPASGDTCYQIAAKYLNRIGASIYDEQNPTIPAPTNPISYQWFSSLPGG